MERTGGREEGFAQRLKLFDANVESAAENDMTSLRHGATERDMTSLRQSVTESGVTALTANVATYPDYCQTLTITGRFRILLSNITVILRLI